MTKNILITMRTDCVSNDIYESELGGWRGTSFVCYVSIFLFFFFFFKCCVNIFHLLYDDNDSFLKIFEGERVTLRVLVMESLSLNPLNYCIIDYLLLLVWWSLFWVHWIFFASNVVVKSSIGLASIGLVPIFPYANDNPLIFVNFCCSYLPFPFYSFPILYTYTWNFFK